MNPQQLRKLERLAKVLDNGDVELLTQLDQLEQKVDADMANVMAVVTKALAVAEQTKKLEGKPGYTPVKGKDYFDGKDGEDYILTDKDKKEIAKSINVPVVERVIERIETVIKEQPIVTNEIVEKIIEKEVAVLDEATVAYLEDEIKKIDKKNGGYGQVIRKLRAGRNVSIDDSNMEYPVVNNTNPKITVSPDAPTDPVEDDIWLDTDATPSSGGGAWGDITGTLSDQTDLQAALDSKVGVTPMVILTKSSSINQNVGGANGAETYWTWDGETIKDATFTHDNTTNSERVTVADDGWYEITFIGGAQTTGSSRTTLQGIHRINGGTTSRAGSLRNYTRGASYGNITTGIIYTVQLTAGDYIEVGTRVEDTDAAYVINTNGGEISDDCHQLVIKKIR